MKNRICILILLLFIGVMVCSVCANDDHFFENKTNEQYYDQMSAAYANEKLYDSFAFNETYIYPEDFSGTYLVKDVLHILLTNDNNIESYKNIVKDYSNSVTFDYVKYSYNELEKILDLAVAEIPDEWLCNWGVVVENNNVVIELLADYKYDFLEKYNPKYNKVNDIYKINDLVNVDFVESRVKADASYYAGTSITVGTLGGSGTYNGSSVGLVTAGHCCSSGTNMVISGTVVGNVVFSQFINNGYGDYAIATGVSGVTASNKIICGGGNIAFIHGYLKNPPVGLEVNKYGVSSGLAEGRITNVNFSSTYEGNVTIKGLTRMFITNGNSTHGDSGGPYWKGTDFCGIHSGSDSIYTNFTPYAYLYNRGFRIATS